MPTALDDCEKHLLQELENLKRFEKAIKDALEAIKNLRKLGEKPIGTPEEMVQQILTASIKGHAATKDPTMNKENNRIPNDEVKESNSVNQNDSAVADDHASSDDKLITHLFVSAGPKIGVKYKVEVTSPVGNDGTFWACHVESGFIQDKLEPLSERLRVATQNNHNLWNVSDLTKLVCLKSSDFKLWMRGKVIKHINEQTVRVRFIDVGGIEDIQKSRLSRVPEDLAVIPFMAFNCTLSEDKLKLDYEAKWIFSDLTKKKILNFTVKQLITRDQEVYAYGLLETILDNPAVNINEKIVSLCGFTGTKSPKSNDGGSSGGVSIVSRDIRVQGGQDEGFTSVSEIIRNKPKTPDMNPSAQSISLPQLPLENSQPQPASGSKFKDRHPPDLAPIVIPEPGMSNWGESITPGLDEHVSLSPLDDAIFDSPTGTMNESQQISQLRKISDPSIRAQQAVVSTQPKSDVRQIEDNLKKLVQQKEQTLRTPSSSERNQLLQNIQQTINDYQQVLRDLQNNHSAVKSPPGHISPPCNMGGFQQFSVPQQAPIGTRPQLVQTTAPGSIQQRQQMGLLKESNLENQDYNLKMKQLSDISRFLKTPSDVLDHQQIQQLQLAKGYLSHQLQEEENRKKQMETMLRMNEQQQQQQILQHMGPTLTNDSQVSSQFEKLQNLIQLKGSMKQAQNSNSEGIMNQAENRHSAEPSKQTQVMEGNFNGNHRAKTATSPTKKSEDKSHRDSGTVEISHTSQNETKKFRNFKVPPFDTLLNEPKKDWIVRELLNLEHPYLTDPKVRFFSVICIEVRPGHFMPNLMQTYQRNEMWLLESDAKPFKKEWAKIEGPVFILIKHKPANGGQWKSGGICQVVSNIQPLSHPHAKCHHQCKVNMISTAVIDDIDLRSDPVSHEVSQDLARRFIGRLNCALQEGTCVSLFQYQDELGRKNGSQTSYFSDTRGSNFSTTYPQLQQSPRPAPSSSNNHFATQHSMEEDWDLELESTMQKSLASSEDIASGDEGERDLTAEREAFGLDD